MKLTKKEMELLRGCGNESTTETEEAMPGNRPGGGTR